MVTDQTVEELKGYLNITWNDEDKDLKRYLKSGAAFLNRKAGVKLNFDNEDDKQLLFDYCRYVYNHSFELFEHNFHSQLLDLSLREGVKDHANSETDPESGS